MPPTKKSPKNQPKPLPPRDPKSQQWVARLRQVMIDYRLTQADVAQLALVSIKTVESWMASDGSASQRNMPERHLRTVELAIAARRRRKG